MYRIIEWKIFKYKDDIKIIITKYHNVIAALCMHVY